MGRHADGIREIIQSIPRSHKGLTPEVAGAFITQLANHSLRIIGELEDAIEAAERENAGLTEMLLEHNIVPEWTPGEGL